MAVAITVKGHATELKLVRAHGTMTVSGNYPAGGESFPANFAIKSSKAPGVVEFNNASAYRITYVGGKIRFFLMNTGAELAAGAYPGALTGDTIEWLAWFPKGK